MLTLVAAIALCQQDDPYVKLRDGWGKLQEAWKAIGDYHASAAKAPRLRPGEKVPKPDDLPDELVRLMGRASAAIENAGLWEPDVSPDLIAVRLAFKARLSGVARPRAGGVFDVPTSEEDLKVLNEEYQRLAREYEQATEEFYRRQSGEGEKDKPEKKPSAGEFEDSIAALAKLMSQKADEDLVQEATTRVRMSLRAAGIFDDETPPWIRVRLTAVVRALTLGEKMPEPAKATADQEKRSKELLDAIAAGDLEGREEAVRDLLRMGESVVPMVRKRLSETEDAEVKLRLRKILGHREKKKEP
jgi:hypothetical protein